MESSDNQVPRYAVPTANNGATAVEIASGLEAIQTFGDTDETLMIGEDDGFFNEEFTIKEIFTDEDLKRFVKSVERLVRSSEEYGQYISYFYHISGATRCSILGNIDMSIDGMGLELHHCPLTLYDICEIVIAHKFATGRAITSLTVADEIMNIHSKNFIGVVPLSVSAHKLVHAGILKVHWSQVVGNWVQFIRQYNQGVTADHLNKVITFTKTTEEEVLSTYSKMNVDIQSIIKIQTVSEHDRIAVLDSLASLPGITLEGNV